MRPRLGAHLNGGVRGALEHARRIGLGHGLDGGEGGPIQIWSRNPSAWRPVAHDPADIDRFRRGCADADLAPVFTHGIYLMNFASPDERLWTQSIEALVDHLVVGAQLGARAVVVHPGSGMTLAPDAALERCARAIRRALEQTEGLAARPLVALETCAGAGRTIGRTFGDLAALLERLEHHPAIAFVLDTAHLYGSGYDVATEDGLRATIDELVATLPAQRLVAIHANDSKAPLGSHRDRHENIGEGAIGAVAFARLLAHPLLRPLPWILEVPGYDGTGPDAQNLATLRRLAAGDGATTPAGDGGNVPPGDGSPAALRRP